MSFEIIMQLSILRILKANYSFKKDIYDCNKKSIWILYVLKLNFFILEQYLSLYFTILQIFNKI